LKHKDLSREGWRSGASAFSHGRTFWEKGQKLAKAQRDDVEFVTTVTLLLLNEPGSETHYLHVASGHCGSARGDIFSCDLVGARRSLALPWGK
jgi:hypothetical protein